MRSIPMRGLTAPFKLFAMNIEPFNRLRWATYDAGLVLGTERVSKFRDVAPTVRTPKLAPQLGAG